MQKQFSDLFGIAAESVSSTSRRTSSNRGRKPPTKKETAASASSKKSESNKKAYSSGSSDVSIFKVKPKSTDFWSLNPINFSFHRRNGANKSQQKDERRQSAIPTDITWIPFQKIIHEKATLSTQISERFSCKKIWGKEFFFVQSARSKLYIFLFDGKVSRFRFYSLRVIV